MKFVFGTTVVCLLLLACEPADSDHLPDTLIRFVSMLSGNYSNINNYNNQPNAYNNNPNDYKVFIIKPVEINLLKPMITAYVEEKLKPEETRKMIALFTESNDRFIVDFYNLTDPVKYNSDKDDYSDFNQNDIEPIAFVQAVFTSSGTDSYLGNYQYASPDGYVLTSATFTCPSVTYGILNFIAAQNSPMMYTLPKLNSFPLPAYVLGDHTNFAEPCMA